MDKSGISPEHNKYLKNIKIKKSLVIGGRILLLVAFICLWELLARTDIIDAFIFSSPSRIIKTIGDLINDGSLAKHTFITLKETVYSFLIATAAGTLIAIVLWWFETFRNILEPYLVVLNSLPKIALGPIIIIWVGAGEKAIVAMGVLISIIITIMSMESAFLETDKEKILLLRSMGAKKYQILFKLILPASLPNFIAVLKINVGMAWVGTIMGEYLVSKAGLGYLIVYGGQVFKLDLVMASTVILCFLAGIMYFAIVLAEKIFIKKRS